MTFIPQFQATPARNHVIALPPPPNLNAALADEPISELVTKYKSLRKQSAEAFIRMGEMILAVGHRSRDEQNEFFRGIGLASSPATIRKLRQVGRIGVRLQPFLARLPDNWTTLYAMASLGEEKITILLKSNVLNPSLTAKELRKYFELSDGTERRRRLVQRAIIHLPDLAGAELKEFSKEFKDLSRRYGAKISYSADLSDFLVNRA